VFEINVNLGLSQFAKKLKACRINTINRNKFEYKNPLSVNKWRNTGTNKTNIENTLFIQ
jgi:hypothetical protein